MLWFGSAASALLAIALFIEFCCLGGYSDVPPNCKLLPDPGPCLQLIRQYYYNTFTQSCVKFNYGGCRGNKNRFKSIADCQQFCMKNKKSAKTKGPLNKATHSRKRCKVQKKRNCKNCKPKN